MIVDEGKITLLEEQVPALETYEWGLFTNNYTVVDSTVLSDLTEAAWSGYSRVTVGTLGAVTIVATRAQTIPNILPVFTNGSGSPVVIYGWFLVRPSDSKLIAAETVGSTTIPAGQTYGLAGAISDTQE